MTTITLTLTDEQAKALHDLVVDADMHNGQVAYPSPLPPGTAEAVAKPIVAAIAHDESSLSPTEEILWSEAAAMVVSRAYPLADIGEAMRIMEGWA